MKKILSIIIMILAIMSCAKDDAKINIEDMSVKNDESNINEIKVSSEEAIDFVEIEGQPNY